MPLFKRDFLRAIPVALVLIGVVVGLLGAFWILDANSRLATNLAEQLHNAPEERPEAIPETQAYALLNADRERNALLAQRRNGTIAVGAGLVLLGLGWGGYDMLNRRQAHQNEA